jgi:hypothetical protein
MTLLVDRPHIRSHRMIPRDWSTGKITTVTDTEERRAKHRAENLTMSTREISRIKGFVPNWDQVIGRNKVTVLPPGVDAPTLVPAKRSRWAKFKNRLTALWDWFTLSLVGLLFAFVLCAGGMLAAKVLIILFEELFNGRV